MDRIPRVVEVGTVKPRSLKVSFENGVVKNYDCTEILNMPVFALLKDPAFFKTVHVDPGGYGISWNDSIDLSEYELWTNGKICS
jgi:hypothetical protein